MQSVNLNGMADHIDRNLTILLRNGNTFKLMERSSTRFQFHAAKCIVCVTFELSVAKIERMQMNGRWEDGCVVYVTRSLKDY